MKRHAALIFFTLLIGIGAAAETVSANTSVQIRRIKQDLAVSDVSNPAWERADRVLVDKYWSGRKAPDGRRFSARLLWSDTTLYIRFEAEQAEPLVVSDKPVLNRKTMGLWDRDVCEIFLAPDPREPRRYFEFEVAPTGEWVDVALDLTSGTRISDWKYESGMEAFAAVRDESVVMAIKIPWKAFGKTPKTGDIWLGNLLRCVGKDPGRGYLAWQPTMTKEPAFHVPAKFGEFRFVE